MNEAKRAILYVWRKRKDSIITFLIFTVSLTSIISVFCMAAFAEQSMQLVPQGFSECEQALNTLYKVLRLSKPATGIIILAIISIILLLRLDVRKREIGTYIALGKTKLQMFVQLICEMMIIIAISLPFVGIIGVYSGNAVAKKLALNALKLTMDDMSLNLSSEVAAQKDSLLSSVTGLHISCDPLMFVQAIIIILAGVAVSAILMNLRLQGLQVREILSKSE